MCFHTVSKAVFLSPLNRFLSRKNRKKLSTCGSRDEAAAPMLIGVVLSSSGPESVHDPLCG